MMMHAHRRRRGGARRYRRRGRRIRRRRRLFCLDRHLRVRVDGGGDVAVVVGGDLLLFVQDSLEYRVEGEVALGQHFVDFFCLRWS